MAGKLWLVATPIGNLGDISARALEVLRAADLIAAEDTRNTVRLLNHFEIKKPLTSYHEYNKTEKAYELVREAQAGKNIAVVTDAGMPAISDPGEVLVRVAYETGTEVTIVPGACACVSALAISGLPTRRFAFEAFLPAEKGERAAVLQELQREMRTIVLYEAPHRLLKTLKELRDCLGEERRISLVRELTKIHEEVRRSTLGEAVALYEAPGGAELIRVGADGVAQRGLELGLPMLAPVPAQRYLRCVSARLPKLVASRLLCARIAHGAQALLAAHLGREGYVHR